MPRARGGTVRERCRHLPAACPSAVAAAMMVPSAGELQAQMALKGSREKCACHEVAARMARVRQRALRREAGAPRAAVVSRRGANAAR